MQIRSQLTKYLGEAVVIPKLTETEFRLGSVVRHKDKIALKLYKLMNKTVGENWNAVQRNWEIDLGKSLESVWDHIWKTLW